MEQFRITGQRPLKGVIPVRGSKNAAFPVLAASILTDQDLEVRNLPLIEDVHRAISILESMGARVTWKGERAVRINTADIDPTSIDKKLVTRFRGSIVFLGPLLARFRTIRLPRPGGCVIGARPIDTHLDAFRQMGVRVRERGKEIELQCARTLKNREVILNEFSVTATENVLLFASRFPGATTVKIADFDHQIQDLLRLLEQMGAKGRVSGCHEIVLTGKERLSGARHDLLFDPIEAGTFIVLAAAAGGGITVKHVEVRFLELFLKKLRDFGVRLRVRNLRKGKGDVEVLGVERLAIDKIQSWIFPGIHSDLQSALGVLATQASGSTLLHDPLYEGRLKYLEELNKMGAEIYIADPHRAIINGPTKLQGADLGPFDLRGGAALLIAALIAKGKSTIGNIYQIDRGYERIEERLAAIGADIIREEKA